MPTRRPIDPARPGIPMTTELLTKQSAEFQARRQRELAEKGITPGRVPGEVPEHDPVIESGNAQRPEPAIPQVNVPQQFVAGQAQVKAKLKHPLLAQLEQEFGLEGIDPCEVAVGGHVWTFRPMGFSDHEWMISAALRGVDDRSISLPSMSVASISATLAAIDNVPIYDVLGIETKGRNISDPFNPPADIRRLTSEALLTWFRSELGMYELITRLDKEVDDAFEGRRTSRYPLLDQVSLARQQAKEEEKAQEISSPPTSDGNPGEEHSSTPDSPQSTTSPTASGELRLP